MLADGVRVPSQAEIEEYQGDVQELSALAVAEIAALYLALSEEEASDDEIVEALPPVMRRFMEMAAYISVDWYRDLAQATPRVPNRELGAPEPLVGPTDRISLLDAQEFEPEPAELPPDEALESTVRWALYEPPAEPGEDEFEDEDVRALVGDPEEFRDLDVPESEDAEADEDVAEAEDEPAPVEEDDELEPVEAEEVSELQARVISRLSGATQRYVTNAARDTLEENADEEGVKWARHAQADACAFCRLLATRGAAYLSRETAGEVGATGRIRGSREKGSSYHDDCGCVPVPVRAGDTYEYPAYVAAWDIQYAEASTNARGGLPAVLRAMRRMEREAGGSRH